MPNPINPNQPQYLVVARVARPHGVRGELRVQALTAFPARMRDLDVVYFATAPDTHDNMLEHRVERARPDKNGYWLLRLIGIDDREAADTLRGRYILVSLADAVPLEPGEVYLFQLIGLEVVTIQGETLGNVAEIIETGANDVLIVRGERYGEVLLPVIEQVIKKIDIAANTLTVDPLPGLLPDTQK